MHLDETSFKRWLDAHGETDIDHMDDVVLRAKQLITMVDFSRHRTDEQIYIALFSSRRFNEQNQISQSKIKRVAILYHYFLKSGST